MSHEYEHLKELSDLPERLLRELQEFFVKYHRLEGNEYRLLEREDKAAATESLAAARK